MPFSPGDILIKVDCRAVADTDNTRHHVMLVLGESPDGNPIVMHMLGNPHFKLIQEELVRGKELGLIKCAWAPETRKGIYQIALDCFQSEKFVITNAIVQKHREAVAPFRPDSSLDAKKKLVELEAAFVQWEAKGEDTFTPNPEAITTMSCHEWVMSVIHHACRQTQQPIPQALRIPPHLAWADRLFNTAQYDKSVSIKQIQSLPVLRVAPVAAVENKVEPARVSQSLSALFNRLSLPAALTATSNQKKTNGKVV